jgi:lactate permease
MYTQVLDPVGGSLGLSTIFAVIPLVTLFVLLGGLRWPAQWAALTSLGVAIVVAIAVYSMPVGQTLDAGLEGAVFGLFPIMWIVVNAIWIYNVTTETGHFEVLRRSFGAISSDQRIQAIIIAFCFGALLEALAGFGTPVAICGTMLIGLGFRPLKAAGVALVANTAPVAFGALAIPIITLAQVAGLPQDDLGAMVGRQTPILALFVPFVLVFIVDGMRGIRATWPAALVGGLGFGIGQYVTSNFISVELSDIVASLLSVISLIALLRVWQPGEPVLAESSSGPRPAMAGGSADDPAFEQRVRERKSETRDSPREIFMAYLPYLVIIIVFALAQGPLKDTLAKTIKEFSWPGLHVFSTSGDPVSSVTFVFNYLPAAGTLLLISGIIVMALLRVGPGQALRVYGKTVNQLKWAILTVSSVLGLAYVMNLSGQTLTIGTWLAGAGAVFAVFSPMIGWLGTAVTGSDTSSNALFGALQVKAAASADLNATLLAASNSSGGTLAKMVSPQNLAIGAAAVGLAGKEGDIFRYVIKWSLILLSLLVILVVLQSTAVLSWMVP